MKTKNNFIQCGSGTLRLGAATLMLGLTLLTSCEKLIETELPGNQMDTSLVFSDVQTANAALSGLYAGLWDSSPLSADMSGQLLGYYTDDLDYFALSNPTLMDLFLNQQTENNSAVLNYWTAAYQKIYMANALLEGAERSAGLKEADKKRLMGEALLIRSVLLLHLVQVYGDIPCPLTSDYQINQALPKRSEADVLQLLEADLTLAASLLEDNYRHAERIYVNRKTVQVYLAKTMLLQQKWAAAETVLKEVIGSPLYVFQPNLANVFEKSSKHIIWQLKPKNASDATKEAILYYFTGAPTGPALSSSLVSAFSTADQRKTQWMAAVQSGGNTWYRANKYKNRTANTTEYSVVVRLEEVYLMLAEALVQQNKTGEALPYINATRTRAGLAALQLPIGPAVLKTEILAEYRREFFTEMGQRFFTLKRMGRLNDLMTTKPNWKQRDARWPIPQKELLLNPALKPQNDGY